MRVISGQKPRRSRPAFGRGWLALAGVAAGALAMHLHLNGLPSEFAGQLPLRLVPAPVPGAEVVAPVAARFSLCSGPVRITCVVDGDTLWLEGVKIRIEGIDAPEIGEPKCAAERALGERAKQRLLALLNEGPIEVVAAGFRDRDKYGRKLRDIRRGGRSLGEQLIAEGLAARWAGRHHDWC
jgi:endonuclease YncB( thermonuclease family)